MNGQERDRPYDLILFGGTGYVGRLVAEHLARIASPDLRWAIAGRNSERLQELRFRLTQIKADLSNLPLLNADHLDESRLDQLARETKVVCTTVGPYERVGLPLVQACARNGTHYCDITGEIPFMRASIDAAHRLAQSRRARIVQACGFDSVPFDLGVELLRAEARRRFGSDLTWASSVIRMRGSGSPGGLATVLSRLHDVEQDDVAARLRADPYSLSPETNAQPSDADRDQEEIRFDTAHGVWTAPFVMAPINTRIVRRTLFLTNQSGAFQYREASNYGAGCAGRLRAGVVTVGTKAFYRAARYRLTHAMFRWAAQRRRGRGFFAIDIVGGTATGKEVMVRIEGKGDPGCSVTAQMVAESALSLVADDLPDCFGVLTPASAFGRRLVERLRHVGYRFDLVQGRPTCPRCAAAPPGSSAR